MVSTAKGTTPNYRLPYRVEVGVRLGGCHGDAVRVAWVHPVDVLVNAWHLSRAEAKRRLGQGTLVEWDTRVLPDKRHVQTTWYPLGFEQVMVLDGSMWKLRGNSYRNITFRGLADPLWRRLWCRLHRFFEVL